MCEAKDFPSSERDALMGLVTQLQGQVAQLTAAKEELHQASRRVQASRKAPGGSVLQGWAKQQTQASPAASRVWGRSATESRRLPMKSPSRL